MSFVDREMFDNEMIYGLHKGIFMEVFKEEHFGYQDAMHGTFRVLEPGVMSGQRSFINNNEIIAPFVTYGITARGLPAIGDMLDERAFGRFSQPRVEYAIYKQRKVDGEGKEHFVLSIGISGFVTMNDVQGYFLAEPDNSNGLMLTLGCRVPQIDLQATLSRAIATNYSSIVNVATPCIHGGIPYLERYAPTILEETQVIGFIRDGVRKPTYKGSPHLGCVYVVNAPDASMVEFLDPDYTFMGWLDNDCLTGLCLLQEVLDDNTKTAGNVIFANDRHGMEERIQHLINIPFEPWSALLIKENALLEGNTIWEQARRLSEQTTNNF